MANARLITVKFAVAEDDPAATTEGMVAELQSWYDKEGVSGSFVVTDNEPYNGDPAMFYDLYKEDKADG